MQCLNCGTLVADSSKFCIECGHPSSRRCAACNFRNPPEAKFCAECGASLADGQRSDPQAISAPDLPAASKPAAAAGERRQLTVAFCDLVGSTGLAARIDPEDLRTIIHAFHRCVADTADAFGGFVARYMGDGALLYFGYPRAQEDSAERAVRGALALAENVARLRALGERLQARIGIATGLVVVGELVNVGAAREQTALGETPNLAARLQAAAEPDSVVISDDTKRLVGGLFAYRDLGAVTLKGFDAPVRAWQVTEERRGPSRFEALHSELFPLVGRSEDLELLFRRWSQAAKRDGQLVLISAEPGLGKSRLVKEFRDRIVGADHLTLQYLCSPHHTASALFPFIAQLEHAAGLSRDDAPARRFEKLEALLAPETAEERLELALVAELLAIPIPGEVPTLNIPPQERKKRVFNALLGQLARLAASHRLLVIFEDVHWIDPTSRELLELAIDRVATLPVLMLITCRPEFQPSWTDQPHVTLHALNRLPLRAATMMLAQLTKGRSLSPEVTEHILRRADGVPLFVEELTKTILESGLLRDDGNCLIPAGALPPLAIPTTLHDSLLARLDRLASAKDVAQIGSVVGRTFSYELLSRVAALPDKALLDALGQLTKAGLLFERGTPPHASYHFKHALVQEAAYSSLLLSRRHELHARTGEVLVREFGEIAEGQPELIARHFSEAGLPERAVPYWLRAGQLAAARSAHTEAISSLERGLALLERFGDQGQRDRQEFELQSALGPVLIASRGYSSPEAQRAYLRANELVRDPERRGAILNGLFTIFYNRAAFERALASAQEFVDFADREGESADRCMAHRTMGGACLCTGRFAAALTHGRLALGHYDRESHSGRVWQYPHDLGVGAMCVTSLALWHAGCPDQSATMAASALALAEQLKHANTEGYCRFFAGVLSSYNRRNYQLLESQARKLVEFAESHDTPQWAAYASCFLAPCLTASGRTAEALEQLEKGLARCDRLDIMVLRPTYLGFAAEAKTACGKLDDAEHAIVEALAIAERTQERWMVAGLWGARARIAIASGELDEAARMYVRAIQVAREQGSKMLELRSATELAGVWRRLARISEARELLAPIYREFKEGLEEADLIDAAGVLEQLEGPAQPVGALGPAHRRAKQ